MKITFDTNEIFVPILQNQVDANRRTNVTINYGLAYASRGSSGPCVRFTRDLAVREYVEEAVDAFV